MILERAGYQIIAIDNSKEAVRIFKTSVVDAVVFGDSINGDQRFQLARTFKSLNRAVPIVALSKTSGSQFPVGLVDQHLESLGDPHLLLEALQRVLSRDLNRAQLSCLEGTWSYREGEESAAAKEYHTGTCSLRKNSSVTKSRKP
jgi:CheY-like chemotaxis protein